MYKLTYYLISTWLDTEWGTLIELFLFRPPIAILLSSLWNSNLLLLFWFRAQRTPKCWVSFTVIFERQIAKVSLFSRLDTAMKTEKENMRSTVTNILDKVPNIKKSIEEIKATNESLLNKEDDLDDEINDKFDQLVAMIEQRRTCLLNQLHFRVSSKREKLGIRNRIS